MSQLAAAIFLIFMISSLASAQGIIYQDDSYMDEHALYPPSLEKEWDKIIQDLDFEESLNELVFENYAAKPITLREALFRCEEASGILGIDSDNIFVIVDFGTRKPSTIIWDLNLDKDLTVSEDLDLDSLLKPSRRP